MSIIPEVERLEHDVDVLETALLKKIFENEEILEVQASVTLLGLSKE